MKFTYEFPRDLTDDELERVNTFCDAIADEVQSSAHLCDKPHGKLEEVPEVDATGAPVMLDGVAQVSRFYSEVPACHDCGSHLHHPRGTDLGWICPTVATHSMRPTSADEAIECGRSA